VKKNIAVIGCGYWGKNLIRNFYELGSLRFICDPDKDLAQHFSKKYNVDNLSYSSLLADPKVEGVVLAVPACLHAEMAIEAMNAGKHVFVEKPLAMTIDEGQSMVDSARRNKVQLMVGHLLQYHPVFREIRALVESGDLGTLNYLYSNRLSLGKVRSEEDVIWSFAPHDISMILSLVGQEPEKIRTEATCILRPKIADSAVLHLKFESAVKAHIAVSWIHPLKEQKLVVVGSKGMVVFDDAKPWHEKLALYRHTVNVEHEATTIKMADVKHLQVNESEPLRNECQHFMDIVSTGTPAITDANEGMRVLKVLSAAALSQYRNQEVRINS
jgi:predicted dehydrogenase